MHLQFSKWKDALCPVLLNVYIEVMKQIDFAVSMETLLKSCTNFRSIRLSFESCKHLKLQYTQNENGKGVATVVTTRYSY